MIGTDRNCHIYVPKSNKVLVKKLLKTIIGVTELSETEKVYKDYLSAAIHLVLDGRMPEKWLSTFIKL